MAQTISYDRFKDSIRGSSAPTGLPPVLESLWYDAKQDWNQAHTIAQDIDDRKGYRLHGYLHRKEGDLSNARYWYSKAGMVLPTGSLEEEWEQMVREWL